MLEKLQKWVGCLLFVLMIVVYTWMLFFKEDAPYTENSPYARDKFIHMASDAKRMNINREAQNIARDARFYSHRE